MPVCPKCGEDNPERFRFCGVCGTPLDAASAPATEERKVVSVLFVDLVGFTASSDRADPEDVRARLRPYHTMLKREIERFGGTVEKFIGDAVMAVFGAPVAHEDDTERAVRAAIRITEAIPELNEELPDLELAVRAAVNTGEAVVSLGARPESGEGIVTGDVVNTASRLQQEAPVGGVVVGEATFRATGNAFDYEALDAVQVKGKEDPLPIWQALRTKSLTGMERARTPFIGREDESGLLQQTFTRSLRDSSVQLVTVTGEPGVGKSRLVSEFFTWVDDRPEIIYWRQGRCLPYGEGITFWALGEIVKAQAGILESDPPDEAARKVSDAVDSVTEETSEREWLKTRMAPLVGLAGEVSGAADRSEAFTAWRTFLEAVASTRPLVLLVEDMHWADAAMLEFLEHLVEWANDVPLLVVCTARPELYERHAGWGGGKRNSTTIALSPLSGEETAKLIGVLLSEAVLPAETQAALLEHSGGNPLYAEEFVRMLLDRGILERRGHAVVLAEDREITVPETVQALIAARLDTLSPERKALLQDASVVGKVFWSETLAEMGGLDVDDVRQGLHELARKELVRPARRSSMEGQTEYAFWHILVRDVAYGQIPRTARATKHRAAAEWVERMAGDRVSDHAELLAHHYVDALELARAAGDRSEIAALEASAVRFLTMAAERAFALDIARAADYYRRALEILRDDSPERGALLASLAEVHWYLGEAEEGMRLAEESVRILEHGGEPHALARAMLVLSRNAWLRGDTGRARQLRQDVIDMHEGEAPSKELATAYSLLGGLEMLSGNSAQGIELGKKALPLTREFGLLEEEVRALQFIGICRFDLGDVGGGLDELREALRFGLEKDVPMVPQAYVNLANQVWEIDGPEAALELYRSAIEHAGRRGIVAAATWARSETTWILYDLGRWDEMVEIADAIVDGDPGRTQVTGIVAPYKALVLLRRGRLDEAERLAEWLIPLARQIGDMQVLTPALVIGALIAWMRDDEASMLGFVEEYEQVTSERISWRLYFLPDALRCLVGMGRLDVAKRLMEGISPRGTMHENSMRTVRAILAEAEGNLEEAARTYEEAAAAWAAFPRVIEHGQGLLGAGRCLLELGRSGEATRRLREAREVLAGLGAAPLVAETDLLLERATALSS